MLIKGLIGLAVIVSCFSVLYPKIIGPFISHIFGTNSNSKSEDSTASHQQQGTPQGDGSRPPSMRHNLRPGPHPGMRAAAEMQQSRQSQGSGRGMMGIVLPMYAVGIVVYLVYTLIKVFNKRNPPHIQSDRYGYQDYNQGSDQPEGKFTLDDNFEGDENFEDFLEKKQKQREMEKILTKPDERHITDFEMEQLQRRLAETEDQMTQILEAMQAVQKKVTPDLDVPTADGNANDGLSVKEEMMEKSSDNGKSSEESTQGDHTAKSSDSSPDMESYDIVDKGSNNISDGFTPVLDENIHFDIEDLTAAEIHTNATNKMGSDQNKEELEKPGTDEDEMTDELVVLEDTEGDHAEDTNLRKRKPRTNMSD